MTSNNDFQRAWYIWMHTDAPVSNYYFKYANAPAYNFEASLNNLVGFVYWVGHNAIGKPDSDYSSLATKGLKDVEDLKTELEKSEISESDKQNYREYLFITCNLLEELMKLPLIDKNDPQP